ncbi:hypothetical protein K1W69_01940 [Hoeflea sp. WL0058]|uniref:DUF306 domain-containing protein n=1 Tax=Flavimaribacter sediminis TaxID=2865987 RepID=A0AAE3CY87_9HYPH|nr:hypothetical protein [Flavimaribacter sediminis]MBW8635930.1 hypothetical protein [Flavimaribacter sediminis]
MRKFFRLSATATALALATGAVSAADDNFAGYYVGIDDKDGSVDNLSIVEMPDGSFKITVSSSGLGFCEEGRSPGFITATGRLDGDSLVRENVVAKCVGSEETFKLSDGTYTRSDDEDVLSIQAPQGRLNYYHRISDD